MNNVDDLMLKAKSKKEWKEQSESDDKDDEGHDSDNI